MKKYSVLIIVLVGLLLSSCSEYQKLLKSNDLDLKYTKAVEYFDKGDYLRANSLFEEVTPFFRGTDRAEDLLNYIARSYLGQKDYYTAAEYFKLYVRTYPKGKYVEESKFMVGYCFSLESPDPRLDQTMTYQAIDALQEFVDIYPYNDRVPEANELLDKLKDKLAYKAYLNAKLYYNMCNYLGNNYLSAVIVAENALKSYPSTKYREDLSIIILESKYQQAVQSIEEKMEERYMETIDEYYGFVNEFPESKYRKQADKIFNESNKATRNN